MRAATYSRYSSAAQKESSIADQQRNCHARAKADGFKVIEDYADRAISGTDSKRPGYLAMQAAAMAKEFDVLIVDDLSRLTRDTVEQERLMRRLEFQGVRIISVSDGYDSRSAARKIHRGMKGMINSIYLDDLAAKVHRGQTGQAKKGFWNGGRPYGYRLVEERDPKAIQKYGREGRIGTRLEINPEQAKVVRGIYERFGEGASCLTIARELNEAGVASPGSSWKRVTRRCSGWMNSSVRVILRNPLYRGIVRWNTNQFVLNPDTEKHLRRARPEKEWITHKDADLQIVGDALWAKCQKRWQKVSDDDPRLKSGGASKHLLSGLMVCGHCSANFILGNARTYRCSGVINGRACKQEARATKASLEAAIIEPIKAQLGDPERVSRMAREMQKMWSEHVKAQSARAEKVPREIAELDARIERLRVRLAKGDPDMTTDDLQAAIDRLESKRRALVAEQPEAKASARVLSMLPKAADAYRKQITQGLDGDPRAAARARVLLRDLLGPITLDQDKSGQVWASYKLNRAALLGRCGTNGRGERI